MKRRDESENSRLNKANYENKGLEKDEEHKSSII